MQIQKMLQVGNSGGFIVPREWRQELGINIGDEIELGKKGRVITVKPHQKKEKKYQAINPKFAKIVDEFMDEHKDVLEALSKM